MSGFSDAARLHAQLRADSVALLRALDARNSVDTLIAFGRFQRSVDSHLTSDISSGFRLLQRSDRGLLRIAAGKMIEERAAFERAFEFFALRWRVAREAELASMAFRDELESIVSALMKQVLAEERMLVLLAHVA